MRKRIGAAAVAAALASTPMDSEFVPFGGGLDIVTPPLFLDSGFVRASQNYEADVNGGYTRVTGYERFDGQALPSDAAYAIITATISGTVDVGDTVTGADSGATGVCIARPTGQIVLTKVSGTFLSGENLEVSASVEAVADSAAIVDGAATALLHAQYKNRAADEYRDDIAAVPGSGNILGVVRHGGVTYAFRNNAGATAAALYKSSSSGWTAVALGRELSFTSGGTTAIAEGDTIEGATSGATAVVTRVVLESGSWAAGTAAGRLIFASQTGTFQAEDLDVGASTNLATIAGDSAAITLLPGGRYKFIIKNFGGSTATKRVYGCDGVNRGFEFDGSVFVPIDTGMTTDAPDLVYEHKNHLFFAFGASVQHSGPATPYIWSVVLGAAELAMGDDVTGFMTQPGNETNGALLILTRNRASILYGTSVSNWVLAPYREELGAYTHSVQDVGYTMFLDDQGITNFQTSQAFGNFAHNALSQRIRPWLNTQRTKVTDSCISRDKSQYRLFFSDQYALYVTHNGRKVVGMMQQLFSHAVRCIWSGEESDGTERTFFGSTNGMVYELDKGTSFDGDAIEAYIHLAFNFSKSPRINKSYRECALEVSGSGYADFNFTYSLGYGSTDVPQPASQSVTTSFSSAFWDSFTWDAFIWDGQTLMPAVVGMEGTAVNVSVMIRSSSDYHQPIRFSGANVLFSKRRIVRGA